VALDFMMKNSTVTLIKGRWVVTKLIPNWEVFEPPVEKHSKQQITGADSADRASPQATTQTTEHCQPIARADESQDYLSPFGISCSKGSL
jgi:hypothetical protein